MAHHTPRLPARHREALWLPLLIFATLVTFAGAVTAAEVTVQNDSLVDGASANVVPGFATGERAAAWLTSPCTGNIVALQIFWRSLIGGTGTSLESAIFLFEAGTFPDPGGVLLNLAGPLLTDGNSFNEFRYTDENNTVPIQVPVTAGQTFVLALEIENPQSLVSPSVVNDAAGCKPNRNAVYELTTGFQWTDACTIGGTGISGNWVLRAVVNCPDAEVPFFADGFESGNLSAWSSSVP